MNIKRQMTLALLLPTLLIGGGLLSFVMINNQQVLSVYNQERMFNKLEAYSAKVTHLLTIAETDGRLIADYGSRDLMRLQSYVHAISHKHTELNYYVIYLPQSPLFEKSFGYGQKADAATPALLPLPPKSYFTQDLLDPEKQWFFNLFKDNAMHWYGPYEKSSGKDKAYVLTYALPIYQQDNMIGVIAIDYPLATLQNSLSKMTYYPSGYLALLDRDLKFIAHPTLKPGLTITEQAGEAYRFMDTRFRTTDSGQLSYTWVDQQKKVLVYKRLYNHWVLALTTYEKEAFVQNSLMNQKLTTLFLGAIGIVSIASLLIGSSISKPLIRLTNSLTAPAPDRDALINHMAQKNDEIGNLAKRLAHYLQLNEKEAAELSHYNDNLDRLTVERIAADFQANVALLKQEETIQKRQALLKLENEHLERSIQEMVATERQLVDQEKMASFRNIIAGVSTEIKNPLSGAQHTLSHMQNALTRLKTHILNSPEQAGHIHTLALSVQKNNRRLFSNLMFAKDIVDYIKDLATDDNLRPLDTIELSDYLKKAAAVLDYLEGDEGITLIMPPAEPLYLQLDASKFLHVLSSLLMHLTAKSWSKLPRLVLTINAEPRDKDLELRFIGRVASDSTALAEVTSKIDLDFTMLELLIEEGFKGNFSFAVDDAYTFSLLFPDVIVDADV